MTGQMPLGRRGHIQSFGVALLALLIGGCNWFDDDADDPPDNPPPILLTANFTTAEDVLFVGQLVAEDPGDQLVFAVTANPTSGALTSFNSSGNFSYQPAVDFHGADSFGVLITDSAGQSVAAIVNLTIAAVNDPPVAANDVFTATGSLAVTANDTDVEGDALTVELLGSPLVGTATVLPDNTISVSLPTGFKGFTRFAYRIRDAHGLTSDAAALVFVDVQPFKVVFLGQPVGGGEQGIYVNDLFTTTLVSPPPDPAMTSMTLRLAGSDGLRVMYSMSTGPTAANPSSHSGVYCLHLSGSGEPRELYSDIPQYSTHSLGISADARYVITVRQGTTTHGLVQPPVTTLHDCDDENGREIVVSGRTNFFNAEFNPAGTRLYFTGRTSATNLSGAAYRMDLATGAVTRVSILEPSTNSSPWGVRFTPDETKTVMFWYRPEETLWLSDADEPTTDTLLHESWPMPGEAPLPSSFITPDGLQVLFATRTTGLPGNQYDNPRTLRLAAVETPGSSATLGSVDFGHELDLRLFENERSLVRPDSQAALTVSGCRSSIMSSPILCGLYEVPLTAGSTEVLVTAIGAGATIGQVRYSDDGGKIIYQRDFGGTQLAMVRRGAFGQVAAWFEHIHAHDVGPEGHVVSITDEAASYPAYIVNLDAPDARLAVGTTTAVGKVWIVKR